MGIIENLVKTTTKTISRVVAFMFFVFTAGMLFGLFIQNSAHPWLLFIPPILGLLAFYSETIAILIFVLTLVIFIL